MMESHDLVPGLFTRDDLREKKKQEKEEEEKNNPSAILAEVIFL